MTAQYSAFPTLKNLLQALFLLGLLAPSLCLAQLFPKNSPVKLIDAKGFAKVMKANNTGLAAFVAPWCGYCQKLVPEYVKVATALHPMVSVYAIDCDADPNKQLCAEQGVKGFPTIKLFPRGSELSPMTYDGERTAGSIFKWTSLRIPHTIDKLSKFRDIEAWRKKNLDKNRILLVTKDSKVPILWKVLSNNFKGKLSLGIHRDKDGSSFEKFGLDSKSSKVLVFPSTSIKYALYDDKTKMEPLSKFFNSIIDGTVELKYSDVDESTSEDLADKGAQTQAKDEL